MHIKNPFQRAKLLKKRAVSFVSLRGAVHDQSGFSRFLVFAIGGLVILSLIGGVAYKNSQDKIAKSDQAEQVKEDSAAPINKPPQSLTLEEQIQIAEKRIQDGDEGYDAYKTVAELYRTKKDYQKAINSFERARALADPADPSYKVNISYIDSVIKELKENQLKGN